MNWKRLSLVLFLLLGVMTLADILLIRQNVQMRKLLPAAKGVQVGAQLPAFSGRDSTGQPVDVSYDGSGPRRIYFYFTPTCKFCQKQFAYWKEILQQSPGHDLVVMGLVKENEDKRALDDFLKQMGCAKDSPIPLKIAFVSDRVRHDYGLSATPVTLLTDNRGAVEKSWVGAWTEAELTEAVSVLKLTISSQ